MDEEETELLRRGQCLDGLGESKLDTVFIAGVDDTPISRRPRDGRAISLIRAGVQKGQRRGRVAARTWCERGCRRPLKEDFNASLAAKEN